MRLHRLRFTVRMCDRFESAWWSGERPRIEDYLVEALDSERPALLRDLLALDLAYRGWAGERPMPQKYRSRLAAENADDGSPFFNSSGSSRRMDRIKLQGQRPSYQIGPARGPVVWRSPRWERRSHRRDLTCPNDDCRHRGSLFAHMAISGSTGQPRAAGATPDCSKFFGSLGPRPRFLNQ
jgi:hypothetical protein